MTNAAIPSAAPSRPRARQWSLGARARYILWRIGILVLSLWILVTGTFLLIRLIPGDPVRAMLGPHVAPELVEAKRHELGLDQPVLTQYWHFLQGLATGDLGDSMTLRTPVFEVLMSRLPVTLLLATASIIVILTTSIVLGFLVAVRTYHHPGSRFETAFIGGTSLIHTIPEFVMGVLLVYIFSVTLHWLPVAGLSSNLGYVLPIVALSLGHLAGFSRIVRVEALRVLAEDYVTTARSKRLPARIIYFRHCLPNIVAAVLTIGGLALSGLLSGTVVVENVFALPGLGTTVVDAISANDFVLIQGTVLVLGTFVLLINFTIDLLINRFNPRSGVAK